MLLVENVTHKYIRKKRISVFEHSAKFGRRKTEGMFIDRHCHVSLIAHFYGRNASGEYLVPAL